MHKGVASSVAKFPYIPAHFAYPFALLTNCGLTGHSEAVAGK